MKDLNSLRIPQTAKSVTYPVIEYTDSFCKRHLDEEYVELCRRLAAKLGRKRPTPMSRGDLKTWAGAVIYTVGSMNFLFDRSQHPHMTADQISDLTGVPKRTLANKARAIRDLLNIRPFELDLCRRELLADHPAAWLIQVDGLAVDARTLPRELQEQAHRKGLIPDPRDFHVELAGPEPAQR